MSQENNTMDTQGVSMGLLDPQAARQLRRSAERLSREAELELFARWRQGGDRAAFDALVLSLEGLVGALAWGYRGYRMEAEDLLQEGRIGAIKATRQFDCAAGPRLATYAKPWIDGAIKSYIRNNLRPIRLGAGAAASAAFFGLHRAQRKVGGSGPGADAAVAAELGVPESDARAAREWFASSFPSIDAPHPDAGEDRGGWDLPSPWPGPEALVLRAEREAAARSLLEVGRVAAETLRPQAGQVGLQRVLSPERPTLQEVGDRLGITRERVRQLEAVAARQILPALRRAPRLLEAALDRPSGSLGEPLLPEPEAARARPARSALAPSRAMSLAEELGSMEAVAKALGWSRAELAARRKAEPAIEAALSQGLARRREKGLAAGRGRPPGPPLDASRVESLAEELGSVRGVAKALGCTATRLTARLKAESALAAAFARGVSRRQPRSLGGGRGSRRRPQGDAAHQAGAPA